MPTSLFPMRPEEITLSREKKHTHYHPYWWHFVLRLSRGSRGRGRSTPTASIGAVLMTAIMADRTRLHVILSKADMIECGIIFFCACEYTACIRTKKRTGVGGWWRALTASDSLCFQSPCIRFITFLSLRLVDAPRVQLHWYGRGEAQAVTMTSFLVHYLHTQSPPGECVRGVRRSA